MCGPDNFVSIMTSGNTMFVQFVSHGNTNGTGFQAHWSASQGGDLCALFNKWVNLECTAELFFFKY